MLVVNVQADEQSLVDMSLLLKHAGCNLKASNTKHLIIGTLGSIPYRTREQ